MLKKSEWGPKLWNFIHACSFAFPQNPTPEEKKAFTGLLDSLRVLVPCPDCRNHYTTYLDKVPPPVDCGEELQKWLIDFHNNVNARIGKDVVSPSEVFEKYKAVRMQTSSDDKPLSDDKTSSDDPYYFFKSTTTKVLLFIVFLLAIVFFYRNR